MLKESAPGGRAPPSGAAASRRRNRKRKSLANAGSGKDYAGESEENE
jgi:hypothetical protein